MTAPEELLAPDGSVRILPSLVGPVGEALALYIGALVRANGTGMNDDARTQMRAFKLAATQPSSAPGTPIPPPANVDHGIASRLVVPMGEVAAVLGCSVEYARRLARTGRLRAHRVGEHGPWLTTPEDLDAYRYGRTEEPHGEPGPDNQG